MTKITCRSGAKTMRHSRAPGRVSCADAHERPNPAGSRRERCVAFATPWREGNVFDAETSPLPLARGDRWRHARFCPFVTSLRRL